MSWRIVYIEEADMLSLYLDSIKIRKQDFDIKIPLSDIHTIIIDNYKLVLSVQLINKCMYYNINMVICGINHMPETLALPFLGNQQIPVMLRKQISWTDERKNKAYSKMIKNKIMNQRKILVFKKKSDSVIGKLKEFEEEVVNGDLGNREGLAAKMYFREIFGNGFKRFEEDVVNAGLNYGYSILRSQITKTLIAKGLNTTLGIFHRGPNNNFNLSDDIIEPFRPIIDKWVYENLLEASIFKKEHRIGLVKATTVNVKVDSQKQTIFNAISIYVDGIARFFESGDICDIKEIEILDV